MANPAPLADRGAQESAEAVPSQTKQKPQTTETRSPQPPIKFLEFWGNCGRMMNHGHRPYASRKKIQTASA